MKSAGPNNGLDFLGNDPQKTSFMNGSRNSSRWIRKRTNFISYPMNFGVPVKFRVYSN